MCRGFDIQCAMGETHKTRFIEITAQTSLMKNIDTVPASYKEVFVIYGGKTRIVILEISSLQFAQKIATQGKELKPFVFCITHYQSVVIVDNESNRTIKLSIIGSLTPYVMYVHSCFVKYHDTMSPRIRNIEFVLMINSTFWVCITVWGSEGK